MITNNAIFSIKCARQSFSRPCQRSCYGNPRARVKPGRNGCGALLLRKEIIVPKTTDGSHPGFGFTTEQEVVNYVMDPVNRVEFIRVVFPDILGRAMDFAIPSRELASAFSDGKGFDGSSVEGFVRIEESDLVIKPEAGTFRLLPWEYQGFSPDVRWREFAKLLSSPRLPSDLGSN